MKEECKMMVRGEDTRLIGEKFLGLSCTVAMPVYCSVYNDTSNQAATEYT